MPKSSRTVELSENIDLCNFAFFVSGGFSKLFQALGELESSGAHQSMQNDLAHLTESAGLAINCCVQGYDRKSAPADACRGRSFADDAHPRPRAISIDVKEALRVPGGNQA